VDINNRRLASKSLIVVACCVAVSLNSTASAQERFVPDEVDSTRFEFETSALIWRCSSVDDPRTPTAELPRVEALEVVPERLGRDAVPMVPAVLASQGRPAFPEIPPVPARPAVAGRPAVAAAGGRPAVEAVPPLPALPEVPGRPAIPAVPRARGAAGRRLVPAVAGLPEVPLAPGRAAVPAVDAVPEVLPMCDPANPAQQNCRRLPPRQSRFVVLASGETNVLIRFSPWRDNDSHSRVLQDIYNGPQDEYTWCARRSELARTTRRARQPGARFVTDAILIPFKLRPGWRDLQFDFTADVGIAVALGIGGDVTRNFSLSAVGAIGTSMIKYSVGDEDQSRAALTLALGFTAQIHGVDIGLLVGWDQLAAGARNWDYHGKTWLGISIGVNLFQSDTTSESQ
jgi:hypothetical protein